jgi:hypothetical protein
MESERPRPAGRSTAESQLIVTITPTFNKVTFCFSSSGLARCREGRRTSKWAATKPAKWHRQAPQGCPRHLPESDNWSKGRMNGNSPKFKSQKKEKRRENYKMVKHEEENQSYLTRRKAKVFYFGNSKLP